MKRRTRFVVARNTLICTGLLAGFLSCATARMRSDELGRVAKDWCLSIRASQIMPVYPLTEDLQPGDVFLVQTALSEQVRIWESKGYLPLENQVVRLSVPAKAWHRFYGIRHGIQDNQLPPEYWESSDSNAKAAHRWDVAPHAAFPTYRFSVAKSGGASIALPVQGVPVGMNLLGASSASGCITIADAYTYGIGMAELHGLLQQWASRNRARLEQLCPLVQENSLNPKPGIQTLCNLRVVQRVFLTGRVQVSLGTEKGVGTSVSAGAPPAVNALNFGKSPREASGNLTAINEALAGRSSASGSTEVAVAGTGEVPATGTSVNPIPAAPGGALRVIMASSRSITLEETFSRPLVIGYIGFDVPVLANGALGTPASVWDKIRTRHEEPTKPIVYARDPNGDAIAVWLEKDKDHRESLAKWLQDDRGLEVDPSDIVQGAEYGDLRREIVRFFSITPAKP